jgi:hypothetical protein
MRIYLDKLPTYVQRLIAGRYLIGIEKWRNTYLIVCDVLTRKITSTKVSSRNLFSVLPSYDSNRFLVKDSVNRYFTGIIGEQGIGEFQGVKTLKKGALSALASHRYEPVLRHVVGEKFLLLSEGGAGAMACLSDATPKMESVRHVLSAHKSTRGLVPSPQGTRCALMLDNDSTILCRSSTPYEQHTVEIAVPFAAAVRPYNLRANKKTCFGELPVPRIANITWVGEDTCFIPTDNAVFRIVLSDDKIVSNLFVQYKPTSQIAAYSPSFDSKRLACVLDNHALYVESLDCKQRALRIRLSGIWNWPRVFWLKDNQHVVVTDTSGKLLLLFVGDGSARDTGMLLAANGRGVDHEVARNVAHDVREERFGY